MTYQQTPRNPGRTDFGENAFREVHRPPPGSSAEASGAMLDPTDGERPDQRAVTSGFPTITAAELDAMDCRISYLIDDILAERQPAIIAAPRKGFKTSVAIDLGVSMATGTNALARFKVNNRRRVLVFSAESGQAKLKASMQAVTRSKGVAIGEVSERLSFNFSVPKLLNAADRETLERTIYGRFDVVFIDPVFMAFGGMADDKSKFSIGDVLLELKEIGERTGVTFVLVDHLKIRSADHRFSFPDLSEVGIGFGEWMRQWLLLSHRDEFDKNTGTARLWLNSGGSSGHHSDWSLDILEGPRCDSWSVTVSTRDDAVRKRKSETERRRAEQDRSEIQMLSEKIVNAMRDIPDASRRGETKTAILKQAGIDKGAKYLEDALRKLLDDGQVEQCSFRKGGKDQGGYRLLT